MALKSWARILPGFQPYHDLQALLSTLVGNSVDPVIPWALSYFNGSVVLGFLFGRLLSKPAGPYRSYEGIGLWFRGLGGNGPDFLSRDRERLVCGANRAGNCTHRFHADDGADLQHDARRCIFRIHVASARTITLARHCLRNFRLERADEILGGDRPDQLVGDAAVAPDREGLGHAIDAPVDRGAAKASAPRR